jgi:Protein of unknown function (DUF2796)
MKSTTLVSFSSVTALLFCFYTLGAAAEKRQLEAHVHGVAEVNIAVEGTKATVEIRAPAENIMGFEHEARTDSDKKKRDAALTLLRSRVDQMVLFDPKLRCKSSEMQAAVTEEREARGQEKHAVKEQKVSGEHREVQGTFSVACSAPLAGSRVRFGITKVFPEIHEVKVQVLGDSGQSGATIKNDKDEVRL